MTAASANIAAHLPAMARRQPHRPAVVVPAGRDRSGRPRYMHYTYRQLDEESDALARGLVQLGIGPGVRVVLLVKPGLEFFALVFALFKVAAVMVCIDPGIGLARLGRCLSEAEPAAMIGIPAAHWARRLLGWGRATLRTHVIASRGGLTSLGATSLDALRRLGERSSEPMLAASHADDVAAILFTSGSTGAPKGAVYTHGHFGAQVEALRAAYQIEPGEVDVCTFPLFALFAPALGMTAVVPKMDFTRPARIHPPNLLQVIDDFGATNLFGSPALLRRFADWAVPRGVKLESLRRVISAGAPVSPQVLDDFTRLLPPGVEVHTPYGATEALPVATIGSDEILADTRSRTDRGEGICVGRPVGQVQVRIIRIDDEPIADWSDDLELPPGQIGEIVVRGPVVTQAYYNRPEATAAAKIADPAGGFYHRMGDVGYLDDQGRLWFCGRKSQRVITSDGVLFTIPCEAVFNTHPEVSRTALVAACPNGVTRPVLCVETAQPSTRRERNRIQSELLTIAASHEHTRAIRGIVFHRSFPVDIRHNAKIGREQLAAWAERRLG